MSYEVSLENVTTRLGQLAILEDLDLVVPAGRVTVVMGESGSGKSTLLRVIAGLLPLEQGRIRFGKADVSHQPAHRRGVALAFQNYALYPRQSVARNLELPLIAQTLSDRERRQRFWKRLLRRWKRSVATTSPLDAIDIKIGNMLHRLGIDHLAGRAVEQLSGGEQQRVALGRALIRKPRVLLLDEPLSNVDPARQQGIVGLLHEIFERHRPTTLLVTHDWQEAVLLGDTIAILHGGKIRQHGTPQEIYDQPRDLHVLAFSQQGLLNHIQDLHRVPEGGLVSADNKIRVTPREPLPEGRYDVVFRSEHLLPCPDDRGFLARVCSTSPAAGNHFLTLETAGRRWYAVFDNLTANAGKTLRVELPVDSGWIVDRHGDFVTQVHHLEVRP